MKWMLHIIFYSMLILKTSQSYAFAQDIEGSETMYLKALQLIAEHRFDDAKTMLIKVIENEPKHAGAWLDLAIVQCELGNKNEADRLFDLLAQRFNPPPTILEIIAKQKSQHCADSKFTKQFAFNIERGYDSNVNQGASNANFTLGNGTSQIELTLLPEFLPKSDKFSSISFSANANQPTNGIGAFSYFNLRQYDNYSNFNTALVAAGLEKTWKADKWTTNLSLGSSFLLLNDHFYQKQTGLHASIAPLKLLPKNIQIGFIGGVTTISYPTLTNYDSNTFEIKTQLLYANEQMQLQGTSGYVLDKPKLARPGGERQGSFASVTLKNKISSSLETELSWGRQLWNSQFSYSPGLINEKRRQDTELVKFALILPLSNNQNVRIELRSLNNRENISILQYKNKSILVGWNWQD